MSTPTKLSSFLAYVDNYLYVYRIKYNTSHADNVELKFLANSTPDTIIINCCSVEPTTVRTNDYWYNGTLLRMCTSQSPQVQYGFNFTYTSCYHYEDAFTSTLISLNPDIQTDGVVTTTPPPPTGTVQYLRKTGDTATGPLFLSRNPIEDLEAATKNYVDLEAAKIGLRIAGAETNINNLIAALEVLNPDSTKLNAVIARVTNLENLATTLQSATSANVTSIQALNTDFANLLAEFNPIKTSVTTNTTNILDLLNRVSTLESAPSGTTIATRTVLGNVKIGAGLDIAADGTVSVQPAIQGRATTTNNVLTKLTFGTDNWLPLPVSTALFRVSIVGRNTTVAGQGCSFVIDGTIDNNGTNVTMLGSTIKSKIASSNSSWNADVVIDNVNKGLAVSVTGTNGSTIHWSAKVDLITAD